MPWVPIHESEFADSVDFDFYGAVTFADSIVTQSEWGAAWRIALPTYLPLAFGDPVFRVTVLEWSGSFPEDPFIAPLSWGFSDAPNYIGWPWATESEQFNESPTPDSEWVPSPIEIWLPPPSMWDDFAIIQYAYFGEWDAPTSAQWLIEVWQDDGPPSGECFWTDLVGVTQECGGDVGGPWVPLHMAGIAYDLGVEDGEGSIAGSTVTIDTRHTNSVWWLTMEGFDGEIRLRVTPLSFTATGGDDGGGIYTPARLEVENDNDGYYQIVNQAPPYPDTNFPPFVPEQVDSWENPMLSDIRAEGYLYLNYHIGRCNGDGAPMHEQGQFLIEIWVG